MPLGDSLTLGSGNGVQGGGYRYYMKAWAGSALDFVGSLRTNAGPLSDKDHDGHGGWTTIDLTNGRDGQGCAADWVGAWQPDVILLMTGRNDAQPFSDTYLRLMNLADSIFAVKPNVRIFWSNMILPRDHGTYEVNRCEMFDIALLQTIAEQKSIGRDIRYIDNYRRLRYRTDIYSDNVHLNDLGYRLVADGWVKPFLTQLLLPRSR